jgi:DNA repair photolyase
MAPIIPFITDDDVVMERTVRAIAESGATHISPIVLHLRTGAREWWFRWLEQHRPDLIPRYHDLYGKRAYAPKEYQREITDKVHELARRYGVGRTTRPRQARSIAEPPPQAEQLSFG